MKIAVSIAALAAALMMSPAMAQQAPAPTATEADAFLAKVEKAMFDHSLISSRAAWINSTYISDDSDAVAAYFGAIGTTMTVDYALEAAKYATAPGLSVETKRRLDLLRTALTLPAPTTPGAAQKLNDLSTRLQSTYGKGKGTLNGQPINGSDIEEKMGSSRNPQELKEMWLSWHDNVGAPMRGDYAKLVDIANAGAKELGFADTGAMWRSKYDMPADDFAELTVKIWAEVKPLYDELHCYTRTKLNETYGAEVQPASGPIRADLLGNMWAQEWGNIYDVVAPAGAGDLGFDVGDLLKAKGFVETRPDQVDSPDTPEKQRRGYWEKQMFKIGEGFYSSLGLEPLPATFWDRTQFIKPLDREVVCHASAWDLDNKDDLRVKMCTKINSDDFVTIHHELGHNYYQRAYNKNPYLYLDGANDGFHEAIGDFVALSITPDYLVKIGLLDAAKVPGADKDLGLLLRQAMDKVAFLPFGLLIDKWRWGVFDGSIPQDQMQKGWTDLRLQYQGIIPPAPRDETKFDAGGKYHIPGNTPYTRYFLARILQFQFYEAACKQAGWKGPLHRCSFYGNKDVGAKLNAMLEMGASKPWPDALQTFTGTRTISGKSMTAYFAPLQKWLIQQNEGKSCGW
ncbi:M2 family metallopeptidase [Sphingobium sp. RAC03]|uniref:M2 family metallopeptidase n=1 Tax=Sphingobium sp. RAC03 TaxID=1843368 RepID=UPI00083DEB90|nr:M2 family metallopeptidase [Sphingobium sp. RAC03]AOF98267.1 angiotensin-converting enzyme family protein [Sphingobium sp. RAC03]